MSNNENIIMYKASMYKGHKLAIYLFKSLPISDK